MRSDLKVLVSRAGCLVPAPRERTGCKEGESTARGLGSERTGLQAATEGLSSGQLSRADLHGDSLDPESTRSPELVILVDNGQERPLMALLLHLPES